MIYVMQAVDTVTGELRVWLSEEAADLSLYPGPNPPRDVAVLGTVQDTKRWGTVVRVTEVTYEPTAKAINRGLLINAGRGDGAQSIVLPVTGLEPGASVLIVAEDAATSSTDKVTITAGDSTVELTAQGDSSGCTWNGSRWVCK